MLCGFSHRVVFYILQKEPCKWVWQKIAYSSNNQNDKVGVTELYWSYSYKRMQTRARAKTFLWQCLWLKQPKELCTLKKIHKSNAVKFGENQIFHPPVDSTRNYLFFIEVLKIKYIFLILSNTPQWKYMKSKQSLAIPSSLATLMVTDQLLYPCIYLCLLLSPHYDYSTQFGKVIF